MVYGWRSFFLMGGVAQVCVNESELYVGAWRVNGQGAVRPDRSHHLEARRPHGRCPVNRACIVIEAMLVLESNDMMTEMFILITTDRTSGGEYPQ